MSRSPERIAATLLATALVVGSGSAAWADPAVPPDAAFTIEDLVFPIEDIVPETESMDGTESESKRGGEVTVGITSDVLFPLDKAVLTPQARQRLGQVATKIRAESAGGVVRIEGHTDDQGSDAYNNVLSLKRAQAVRQALQGRLPGVTLQARGFGERRPKLPNVIQGRPVKGNQAKNRRVEIVFNAKQ
jgi:outer membrane protein OmpA-like peptidoglycan-associated protein